MEYFLVSLDAWPKELTWLRHTMESSLHFHAGSGFITNFAGIASIPFPIFPLYISAVWYRLTRAMERREGWTAHKASVAVGRCPQCCHSITSSQALLFSGVSH